MNGLRRLMLDSLDRPVHHTDEGVENFNRWFEGSQAVDAQGRPLVLLHGTRGNFNQFDRGMGGTNTPNSPEDVAFHFTDAPLVADRYADLSGVTGQNVMPAYLNISNPKVFEGRVNIGADDINEAISGGHDGIVVRHGGRIGNEYIAFRPEQIKSATGNSGAYSPNTRDITGAATPAALAATAAAAGTGAALETQRRREAPQQNMLSWLADSAKARWQRTIDDVRDAASAAADFGGEVLGGIKNVPYRALGTAGDLAHLGLSATNPVPGFWGEPKDFPLTSDWMIERGVEAGLRDAPATNSLGEMVGEALPSLFNPANYGNAARRSIFAGQKAATADLAAMRRAEERLASGDDPARVWAEEGWFRGPDGQMRFEIDDSRMSRVDPAAENKPAGWYPRSVGEGFSHPELAAAYPEVQAVRLEGGFFPGDSTGAIYGAYQRPGDGYEEMLFVGGPNETQRSTAAHEIQHSIQHREGFAGGGGSDSVFAYEAPEVGSLNDAVDALEARLLRMTPLDPEWGGVSRELKRAQAAAERAAGQAGYRRLAGEAEARAVQARLPLTAEQRRARYPLEDYDVPLDELIIRR